MRAKTSFARTEEGEHKVHPYEAEVFMGVYEGRGQIAKGIKDLMTRWSETRRDWDDVMSQALERDHLMPLESDARNTLGAMEHIAQILSQVKRDCGE
jgi:hypothetical protein